VLYLTRKIGQSIIINNDIEVVVTEISGKTVKLGFTFPRGASVLRKELHDKIAQENILASEFSADKLPIGAVMVLGNKEKISTTRPDQQEKTEKDE
jgi:carbon storage regulator